MQVKIFTIPIIGGEWLNEELNVFLRTKKILKTEKQFVVTGNNAFWSFCLSYMDDASLPVKGKAKIDYMQVLDKDAFERFSKMRIIRKQLAIDEAIPAYAVFTDEELAQLAKVEQLTLAKIKSVKGIGEKKAEKFGQYFIPNNEKSK